MKISRTLNSLLKFSQDHLNLYAFKLFKNWGKYYFYLQPYSIEAEKSLKIIIKTSFLPVHTMLTCCFLLFPRVAHPDTTSRASSEMWDSVHGSCAQGRALCCRISSRRLGILSPPPDAHTHSCLLTHYLHSHSALYFFTFCS